MAPHSRTPQRGDRAAALRAGNGSTSARAGPLAAASSRSGKGWSSTVANAPATLARNARCCSTRRASAGSRSTAAEISARQYLVELAVGVGHQGFVVVVHAGPPMLRERRAPAGEAAGERADGNLQHRGRFLV